MENKSEAKAVVAGIAADVTEKRGCANASQVKVWARAYAYWRSAVALLTTGETEDAINDGIRAANDKPEPAARDWLSAVARVVIDAICELHHELVKLDRVAARWLGRFSRLWTLPRYERRPPMSEQPDKTE